MNNNKLLIVDDDKSAIKSLIRLLRHDKYQIYSANSGEEGLDILSQINVGVVISDYMMLGMNGIDFLKSVKNTRPKAVRILFTSYADPENAINAVNHSQIFKYITKPWSPEEMKQTVRQAFKHYNLISDNDRL